MNDRQGYITALFTQDRKVREHYSYDAYGRRRNPSNWNDYNVKTPRLITRGYTGHEHMDGFGLINMNGRMYDPVIGRVLSPDPFVSSATSTQSYNRYSYCLNNPLRYTDPTGYHQHPDGWDNGGGGGVEWFQSFGPGPAGPIGIRGSSPGGGSYSYNWYTGEYTNYGQEVSYAEVFNNYVLPNSSINISGPRAGEIVSKVMDGFSIYTYDLYGRQNLVLSIGDPELVANTGSDGGYFTKNPTAGSYVFGAVALANYGGSGTNNGFFEIATKVNNVINNTVELTTGFVIGIQKLGNSVSTAYPIVTEIPVMHTLGRLTGAINVANNVNQFRQDPYKNWWNGVEAAGQIGFYFFGGAEANLIYNLSVMGIDLSIEGYNYFKGR